MVAGPGGVEAVPMETETTPTPPAPERRLVRPSAERQLAGVCAGLARYFGVDPVLFRIGAVALALFGGLGVILYLAAVALIPSDEEGPAETRRRNRGLAGIGVVLLVVAAAILFSGGPFHGPGFGPWVAWPLVLVIGAAVGAWWLMSGERPGPEPRNLLRAIVGGFAILVACFVLAIGGAWLAGIGGGTVAAAVVIALGVALIGAAFARRARWLALPALSLAIPVAFVSAAGIDLHGGAGNREYMPTSVAQVRDHYRVGAGRLIVDLRDVRLPAGDRPLKLDVGAGQAVLIVPADVCVATKARTGIGVVQEFDRDDGGIDVHRDNEPAAAPGNARIVLDAHVGVGDLQIRHDWPDHGRGFHRDLAGQSNTGCVAAHG
jgi:phage shock protein PspC (stress-responsive transcriptional regulator)